MHLGINYNSYCLETLTLLTGRLIVQIVQVQIVFIEIGQKRALNYESTHVHFVNAVVSDNAHVRRKV